MQNSQIKCQCKCSLSHTGSCIFQPCLTLFMFFPLSSGVPQRSVACGHKGQQKIPVVKVLTKDETIKDQ